MSGKCLGSSCGRLLGSGHILCPTSGSRFGGGKWLKLWSLRAPDGAGRGRRRSSALPRRSRRGLCGSAPCAGFPSPPQATCPGPFVWAAKRLCACAWSCLLGGAPGASPRLGPVPVDPVTVTGSGQSPFYKPVQPQTSASRLGRAEASEPGRSRRSFF